MVMSDGVMSDGVMSDGVMSRMRTCWLHFPSSAKKPNEKESSKIAP